MITDITVNNKYVLIYSGDTYKSGTLTTGQVTSPFTVEVFDTVQKIFDRGLALGLKCSTENLIDMMEKGAVIPAPVEADLLSYIWEEDIGYVQRMEALGYTQ